MPNGLSEERLAACQNSIAAAADVLLATIDQEGYRVPITVYPWGSNASVLNNAILIGLAYDLTGDAVYVDGVRESMDYLLGRNAMNKSYVSGYGEDSLEHPHHRFWANQPDGGYPPPPPGVVSGGPNGEPSDPTAEAAGLIGQPPAKSYIDDIGSWSTNEVTINWNAPLAWVAAFLDETRAVSQAESAAEATPEPDATATQPEPEPAAERDPLASFWIAWGVLLVMSAAIVIWFWYRARTAGSDQGGR